MSACLLRAAGSRVLSCFFFRSSRIGITGVAPSVSPDRVTRAARFTQVRSSGLSTLRRRKGVACPVAFLAHLDLRLHSCAKT